MPKIICLSPAISNEETLTRLFSKTEAFVSERRENLEKMLKVHRMTTSSILLYLDHLEFRTFIA